MFSIRNPLALLREYRAAGFANPQSWMFDAFGAARTSAGERVSVDASLAMADVFSAVNIVTSDISQCPLKVFKQVDEDVLEQPQHRAWGMLHDKPNALMPAHRFWATVGGHELLWGNWFIEKLRDQDGLVAELDLIPPDTCSVLFNGAEKRFLVTRFSGEQVELNSDQVLHGFGFSRDGVVGLSRIQQARESLGTARGRERFEAEVYGQKPYLSGVIEHPSTINDGGVKLRESWQALYSGGGGNSRHGVGVLEEGAKFNALTAPLQDMEFVEAAKMSKTQIAVLFGLPPAYLGGSTGDSLTYQTVEGNKIQKATQAVAPVLNNIAQFLSHDPGLFPFQAWFAEFVMEGLLRGDSQARLTYWKGMKDMGVVDEGTIAAAENLPPPPKPKPVPAALQQLPPPNAGGNGAGDPTATTGIIGANG